MDPLTVVQGAIASASHMSGLLTTVVGKIKDSGRHEVVGEIIDTQIAMMDLIEKQKALIELNTDLQKRIAELEERLSVSQSLRFDHNCYWMERRLEPDHELVLEGPYSPTQWELHHRLVRMRKYSDKDRDGAIRFHEPNSKDTTDVPSLFLTQNKVLPYWEP